MVRQAETFATYEDLRKLPPNVVGELLSGEVIATPRPAPRHLHTSSALGVRLGGPFQFGDSGGPGGWWILDEPELHLGEHVMVPDLAGWRKERLPELPEESWFTLAPDWVCEILSPSTARVDRVLKMPLYAEYALEHMWLIDPDVQTLEIYHRAVPLWLLVGSHAGDVVVKAPPFDQVEIDLGDLWAG